jgi:hypothetical protein
MQTHVKVACAHNARQAMDLHHRGSAHHRQPRAHRQVHAQEGASIRVLFGFRHFLLVSRQRTASSRAMLAPHNSPKWRNGRRDGFKIRYPLKVWGFKSPLRHWFFSGSHTPARKCWPRTTWDRWPPKAGTPSHPRRPPMRTGFACCLTRPRLSALRLAPPETTACGALCVGGLFVASFPHRGVQRCAGLRQTTPELSVHSIGPAQQS